MRACTHGRSAWKTCPRRGDTPHLYRTARQAVAHPPLWTGRGRREPRNRDFPHPVQGSRPAESRAIRRYQRPDPRTPTQGCKIGVATLKREDYALTLLEHYHFTELCDSICGSDFANKMTKADVLHKCLKALELSPSEAVLIGDTSSDGKGAKEAAVDFMAVTYGFGPDTAEAWQEYAPVYTAKDTHDIGAFLGVNF
ncbi:MAG: HAD family hydrolase [Clostridium fessum]